MEQFSPPAPLTDSQDEAAIRLLNDLDHWADRCKGHYSTKRTQPRNTFRQRVAVFVPDGFTRFAEKTVYYSFEAWARNLSSGGVSLLYPGQLKFEKAIVCLSPDQEQKRFFYVRTCRNRRVSQDFWEYGMQFEGVVEDGDSPSLD